MLENRVFVPRFPEPVDYSDNERERLRKILAMFELKQWVYQERGNHEFQLVRLGVDVVMGKNKEIVRKDFELNYMWQTYVNELKKMVRRTQMIGAWVQDRYGRVGSVPGSMCAFSSVIAVDKLEHSRFPQDWEREKLWPIGDAEVDEVICGLGRFLKWRMGK